MRRKPIALVSIVGAVAAAAIIATSGTAQTPAASPTVLHLVEKTQKGVGFFPKHRPREGDRLGFGDKVSGDETGVSRWVCTVIGRTEGLCAVVLRLSKGTLTFQGMGHERDTKAPFAVTGGTGAYEGASGTGLFTDVNATTGRFDITLLP